MDNFEKQSLKCHNECRSLHEAPKLTWSAQLASEAQEWVNNLASRNTLQHASKSERKEAGENIAMFSGRYDIAAEEATEMWYSEVEKFDFSNPSFQSGTGHFSQHATFISLVGKEVFGFTERKVLVKLECRETNKPRMSWQRKVEQRTYKVVTNGAGPNQIDRQVKSEVVWKDSKELGMARAKTPDGKNTYVVARYGPAGNFMGKFKENVSSKTSKDTVPSFIKNKPAGEQTQGVDSPRRSPAQSSQTRVVTQETRSTGGVRTVKTTTTWTSSSGNKPDMERFSSPKFGAVKREDPAPKMKSLDISDTKKAQKEEPVSLQEFQKQALQLHNDHRRLHQVPDLRWSKELERDAKAWVEKIARANTMKHAPQNERNGAGENLAYFGGRCGNIAKDSTNMWYDEVKKYQFSRAGYKSGTGHFTQLVWKDSKEIGMAWAKSSDGQSVYVVARYHPAGNMMGTFDKNVFPAKK